MDFKSHFSTRPLILPSLVVVFVLVIDQWSKIWVKTHMYLGQEHRVTDWFIIHFTENPGMAFGLELGGVYGKIFLSLFRIAAVVFIFIFIVRLSKQGVKPIFLVPVGLIFAGALGNILDSVFMVKFSPLPVRPSLPMFLLVLGMVMCSKAGCRYAIFPFNRWSSTYGFPFLGGMEFQFFRPVFNIADSSIFIGILTIIIFQKSFFSQINLDKENLA